VNESPHAIASGGFKHDMRAQDIGLGELEAVAERVVHVRLRSKVHDSVNLKHITK
jgi:hypothetical protein